MIVVQEGIKLSTEINSSIHVSIVLVEKVLKLSGELILSHLVTHGKCPGRLSLNVIRKPPFPCTLV